MAGTKCFFFLVEIGDFSMGNWRGFAVIIPRACDRMNVE